MPLSKIQKVSLSDLFVSQPDPGLFGNPNNEVGNKNWTANNWLKSRFHFSFADYTNYDRQGYGPLRVLNDDLVQPSRGFGTHPHEDAEIVTYVVDGRLTHRDSMRASSETLTRGALQYMSAGTGVEHSEENCDHELPLRVIQMWFRPRRYGLTPAYGSWAGPGQGGKRNQWCHYVGDCERGGAKEGWAAAPVVLNADLDLFVVECDQGYPLTYDVGPGHKAYFLCIEGTVLVQGEDAASEVARHEAAHIKGAYAITITATSKHGAHCLLIDMGQQ